MALINCPECSKEISDKASACINCGCPIEVQHKSIVNNSTDTNSISQSEQPKESATSSPSKSKTGLYVTLAVIGAVVIGVVLLLLLSGSSDLDEAKELVDTILEHGAIIAQNTRRLANETDQEMISELERNISLRETIVRNAEAQLERLIQNMSERDRNALERYIISGR